MEVIARGIDAHPELAMAPPSRSSAAASDPDDDTSNSFIADPSYATALKDTYIIEAYNLKSSIEFDAGNASAAASTLVQMPYRPEQDLSPVTLHNQAIICDVGQDVSSSFRKLQFLLSPPFPPETFANILLLYIKHGYEDLAADLLADNTRLTYDIISEELYQYIDTSLLAATSPDDAMSQFDALGKQILRRICKAAKAVSEAEATGNDEVIAVGHRDLADAMKAYGPVLMAMGKIHWDAGDYQAVDRLLRQSGEYCGDGSACAVNLGHAYFMQNKFREAALCYEPLLNDDRAILDIAPVILANLCVSCVLTDQNERAEEIMALVDKAEDEAASINETCKSKQQLLHGSIINLVIGTLYCQKNNYDFGMSLICKSLYPYQQRLGPDTWFYAKRCLLALLEKMAKQTVTIADETVAKTIAFLDEVDHHGQQISPTAADDEYSYMPSEGATSTIASEARKLKLAFLRSV